MTWSRMLQKIRCNLAAKFWRLIGFTKIAPRYPIWTLTCIVFRIIIAPKRFFGAKKIDPFSLWEELQTKVMEPGQSNGYIWKAWDKPWFAGKIKEVLEKIIRPKNVGQHLSLCHFEGYCFLIKRGHEQCITYFFTPDTWKLAIANLKLGHICWKWQFIMEMFWLKLSHTKNTIKAGGSTAICKMLTGVGNGMDTP